jgi:hypothetical protein
MRDNTFETLPTTRNWGGYGEEYPNEQAIAKAKEIVSLAEALGYRKPEVRPDAMGGVCLSWENQEHLVMDVYCWNHRSDYAWSEHHTESDFKYMIGIDMKTEPYSHHREVTTPTEVITELISFFRLPDWSL